MQTIDFARSFLTFRIDTLKKPPLTTSHKSPHTLNNARIQLDCRCEVREKRRDVIQEFVLGASCKTERVGVDQDLFTDPNADFVPIFSRDTFMNLKAFDRADKGVMFYPPSRGVQPERQVGRVAEAFDSLQIDLHRAEGEVLETPDAIIAATLAKHPLVARTELESELYTALIEYPVKTINVDERDNIYQTDTGPILFPDFARAPEDLLGGFELAFVAFNCPVWAEFILRVKAPVAEGVSVYHYSRRVRVEARSHIIRLLS
ncbi:MAG TPA: hypothetical protein VMW54_11735 [Terriglobia bacterium]|nr:hypothetical protein [Terriglobia bacterium]